MAGWRGTATSSTASGGQAHAGQLWQLTPNGRDGGAPKLIFESPGADVLDAPDNLVVVPGTGDVSCRRTAATISTCAA